MLPQLVTEMVEMQLPFYQTVSEEAAEIAYQFFCSAAGDEWIGLSTKFVLQLNELAQRFARSIVERLENLN